MTLIGTDAYGRASHTQDQGRTLAKRFRAAFDHTPGALIKHAKPRGADHCAARLI
jgi:hypothetical protein